MTDQPLMPAPGTPSTPIACPLGYQCPLNHAPDSDTLAVRSVVSPALLPQGSTTPAPSATMTLAPVNLQTTYAPATHTSFGRTVRSELRKLVDTKAALILLCVGGGLSLLLIPAMAAIIGFTDKSMRERGLPTTPTSFEQCITGASGPIMLFLVIMAIMLATSEWTTRSALTTFTLEPRRGRVLAAKTLVAVGLAVMILLLSFPLGAVAALLADTISHAGIDWSIRWSTMGVFLLATVLTTLFGMAWGLLTRSTSAGIIIYLVVPMVMAVMKGVLFLLFSPKPNGQVGPNGEPVMPKQDDLGQTIMNYISPSAAGELLQMGQFTWSNWLAFGVSQTIWVAIPFVIGTMRWLRSEAK